MYSTKQGNTTDEVTLDKLHSAQVVSVEGRESCRIIHREEVSILRHIAAIWGEDSQEMAKHAMHGQAGLQSTAVCRAPSKYASAILSG